MKAPKKTARARSIPLIVLIVFSVKFSSIFASQSLDSAYSLRSLFAFVLNADEEPVYAEHVQAELIQLIEKSSRFELMDGSYAAFKEKLKKVKHNSISQMRY